MPEDAPAPPPRPNAANKANGHATAFSNPSVLRSRLNGQHPSFQIETAVPQQGYAPSPTHLSPTAQQAPPVPRRRSSMLSYSSLDDMRQSLRSSTDDLLRPRAGRLGRIEEASQEPSHWQSAPVAFAILPVLGGLFFKNGSAFVTDVLLLGFCAVFLNWSVRLPWDWYQSAQAVRSPEAELDELDDTILEESSEDEDEDAVPPEPDAKQSASQDSPRPLQTKPQRPPRLSRDVSQASTSLRQHELFALLACFLAPVAGAYLLHTIRSQLTQRSENLVNDTNLAIFLLGAELRPFSHLIKMVQARTLHLQRVVQNSSASSLVSTSSSHRDEAELLKRLDAVEGKLADVVSGSTPVPSSSASKKVDTSDLEKSIAKGMNPRLDALERAVRRYEKRATAQTMQIEQRFQQLEARILDALSLAAAAARPSQKPGIVVTALGWVSAVFMVPLQAWWTLWVWPWQVAVASVENLWVSARVWLLGRPAKSRKGKSVHAGGGSDRGQGRASARAKPF
ncbi:hypothetical protein B0A49_00039 [Cryomyces minteri]|uniref:Uncharacterized protein n=1 Tax=Cryomyces minteri TaxID=331657 RepID=A0A4U0XXC2_9PEZI|nr:hypothetical protein B0A49_00039 [Cryomyces minteri]